MAAEGEVIILGGPASSFVIRTLMALNLKGLKYTLQPESTLNKSELLLKSNPVYKKMPVMLHKGKPICESMIIVQYIDEVWPEGISLLPADPYERSVARFWTVFIDDKIQPALVGAMKSKTEEEKAKFATQLLEGLDVVEGAFEQCSKGKPFFGGDEINYVDIALGCFIPWLRATERMSGRKFIHPDGNTPLLSAWSDRLYAHHVMKDVLPDPQKLVDFFMKRVAQLKKLAETDGAAATPTTNGK